MGTKADLLTVARGVVVVVVEPGLPNADHPWVLGQFHQTIGAIDPFFASLVGMHPDRAPDIVEPFGNRLYALELT